jgi:hypothetical protein
MFGYGGGISEGPNATVIAQLESELTELAAKERQLIESLAATRAAILEP